MAVELFVIQSLTTNTANELKTDQRRLVATLANAVVGVAAQTAVTLSGIKDAALSVEGTATALAVTIEGSVDGTNYYPLEVVKRGSLDILTSMTAKGVYVVDLSGLTKVRANVTNVAGGNVTVLAK